VTDRTISRLTGIAAVAAGVLLALAAYLQSLEPEGCVGDGCSTSSMREAPTSVTILVSLGGLLVVASGLGLALLLRHRGRLGRAGTAGTVLLVVGVGLLALGSFIQAVFAGGDFSAMPAFVGSGVLALAVGTVLLAVTVVRARIVPVWVLVPMALGVVLLPFGNEQTSSVLLDIPFALSWALAGVLLATAPEPSTLPA
jgi:hypothetical protein